MSQHAPITTTNIAELPVPVSRGFPLIVRLALLAGVSVVLGVLGLVAGSSAFGHDWPWSTAMKIPL